MIGALIPSGAVRDLNVSGHIHFRQETVRAIQSLLQPYLLSGIYTGIRLFHLAHNSGCRIWEIVSEMLFQVQQ